jgi:hypothetical protein
MDNITIGANTYRIGKRLNAMEQFHCSRRLGPALVVASVTFQDILSGRKLAMEDWVGVAGPVMEIVSHMSDEDVEYVIFTCLSVVERAQGSAGWAPVIAPDRKTLLFADMDQFELIRLTVEVMQINLQNFMRGMEGAANLSEGSPMDRP